MPSRKRIRAVSKNVSGGTVAPTVGNVAWGPDFGEGSGNDSVTTTIPKPTLNLDSLSIENTKEVGVSGALVAVVEIQVNPFETGNTIALDQYHIEEYNDWADANVTTTGITNPGNAIDKNEASAATAVAAASGIGGVTSNTTNFNLVSSFPDFSGQILDFTINSVSWEYRFQTASGGTQLSAGAVNFGIRYSVDDGANYTTQETITNVAANPGLTSVDLTSAVGGDWTKISQFRSQVDGSVTSGTGLGKTETMSWFFSRLVINATRNF